MNDAEPPRLITQRPSRKRRRLILVLVAIFVVIGLVGLIGHFASYKSVTARAQAAETQLQQQVSRGDTLLKQCDELANRYVGETICTNRATLGKVADDSRNYLAGIDKQAYKNSEKAEALRQELNEKIAALQAECTTADAAIEQFDALVAKYSADLWRLRRLNGLLHYQLVTATATAETVSFQLRFHPAMENLVNSMQRAEQVIAQRRENPMPALYSTKNAKRLEQTIANMKRLLQLLQDNVQEVMEVQEQQPEPETPQEPQQPEVPENDEPDQPAPPPPAEEPPPAPRPPAPAPPAPPAPPTPEPPPAPEPPVPTPPAPPPDPDPPIPAPPEPPPPAPTSA